MWTCYIRTDAAFWNCENPGPKKKEKKTTLNTQEENNSAHVIGEQIQWLLAISATAVQNVNLSAWVFFFIPLHRRRSANT